MAYNNQIEQRIDALISSWPDIEKKKMFGGVCMCFGIWQEHLIVRTDPVTAKQQLQRDHVRPFDVTGKPMKGWLMVSAEGWPSDPALTEWLVMGRDFSLTLPGK